ncbi:hypothetical protein C8Q75DRAFT_388170 [Abortiporus biennis]|nr:hypothetical protein C8Q75DRAFT_388170 [Abortiporus biennis]
MHIAVRPTSPPPPADTARRASNSLDALIEKAFAPRDTIITSSPDVTPSYIMQRLTSHQETLADSMTKAPTRMPSTQSQSTTRHGGDDDHLSKHDEGEEADKAPSLLGEDEVEQSLNPIWERVRAKKMKDMAALPSKVKSLEGVAVEQLAIPSSTPPPPPPKPSPVVKPTVKKVVKKNSMVNFKESEDGKSITATFDMPGVKKSDMHVSFRSRRLVVSWRKVKIVEKQEGSVLVRERQEKQYSQVIPIPEGTKFDDIRASRDGRRLMLIYPSSRQSGSIPPVPAVPNDNVQTSSTNPVVLVTPPRPEPTMVPLPASPPSTSIHRQSTLQTPPRMLAPEVYEDDEPDADESSTAISETGNTEFHTCLHIADPD